MPCGEWVSVKYEIDGFGIILMIRDCFGMAIWMSSILDLDLTTVSSRTCYAIITS